MNQSSSNQIEDVPPSVLESTIILILSIALSLITIGGNILVLTSFYFEPALRISSNYFIASLAVTDLLIGLFSMNLYTLYIVLGFWPLSQFLCDLWLSMDYTACLTSQYTVFLITVDRFCSIKMPMRYHRWRSDKIIFFMIFLTWVVPSIMFYSIIMSWPYVVGRQRATNECYAEFSIKPVFITVLTVCYFWITLFVMIALYISIYKVALDLQKRSDERKDRVNNFFLISLANRQANQLVQNHTKELCSYESKEEDIYSSSCNTIDNESKCLRHSHSSCFMLSSGQLPNIESPLLSEENWKSPTSDSLHHRYTRSMNKSSSLQASMAYNVIEVHNHYFCNIHRDHSALFRPQQQSCCEIQGFQFLNVENFESSFNLNLDKYAVKEETNALCSSPIWKQRAAGHSNCESSSKTLSSNNREKATSFTLKSPLQKVVKKFYDAIQKTNNMQGNIVHHRKRAIKALRTISLILGAFILCWTPFHVVILIKAACDNHDLRQSCMNTYIYRLAYWLCYINSPLNPFCYALANIQIKETFFRILSCKYGQR